MSAASPAPLAKSTHLADGMPVRDHAGVHLLVDFWDCTHLSETAPIETAMRSAALAAGATVIASHFHHFGETNANEPQGVTGIIMLAESHMSIHTWPEYGLAAIDIFMCGRCDPRRAIPPLRQCFAPARIDVSTHHRGRLAR